LEQAIVSIPITGEPTEKWILPLFGALAAIKPLVLPGVGKKTLVYVIKTSVLQ